MLKPRTFTSNSLYLNLEKVNYFQYPGNKKGNSEYFAQDMIIFIRDGKCQNTNEQIKKCGHEQEAIFAYRPIKI